MDTDVNADPEANVDVLILAVSPDNSPEEPSPTPILPNMTPSDEFNNNDDLAEGSTTEVWVALSEKLTGLQERQASLVNEMEGLRHTFDSKIKYESGKDKIIDALHAELQTYRDDLVFKILRPVILDLIDMHNDISSVLNYEGDAGDQSDTKSNLWNTLFTFQGTIEEILGRNGVEAFSEPGELFVPKRQRSVKVLDTDDPAKDGAIAKRLRSGFVYGNRLIAHERVIVYRYKPGSIVEEPSGGQ